jgi:1-deoxy-D-xylulose-5-phosphate reductoisomerase
MRADDRQRVTVLGATGSIGMNTLDVLARHADRFVVHALTAHHNVERLIQQCAQAQPRYAVLSDGRCAERARDELRQVAPATTVLVGADALAYVAADDETDVVMAAIVGGAGLLPTMAAVQAGKRVLLANKESLVMAGQLFMHAAQQACATLLPIDSEHNAIFQCMPAGYRPGVSAPGVRKILLTASGGPFRDWSAQQLQHATPAQACAHPNWVMGRKISVDSATLMNKGLEVIEACWLFNVASDAITVVLHPQSVIHSMVEYIDGSVLAQLGQPDMRTPIAHALAWPERFESGVASLDFLRLARFDFAAPDTERFPCLRLAFEAARAGADRSIVLNAANEIAVEAFLQEQIPFTAIPVMIEAALAAVPVTQPDSLEHVIVSDRATRDWARAWVSSRREVIYV